MSGCPEWRTGSGEFWETFPQNSEELDVPRPQNDLANVGHSSVCTAQVREIFSVYLCLVWYLAPGDPEP